MSPMQYVTQVSPLSQIASKVGHVWLENEHSIKRIYREKSHSG